MQDVLHTKYYNVNEKEQGKYLIQTRSQAKTSGIILPEVHGIDKGIDPNVRLEKQFVKPVITPQTHILPEVKNISQIKLRMGQGRAGIKIKKLKFFVCQPYDKPEQPKLLPGGRPIIQIAERPTQSRTRSKVSTPESSVIPGRPGHHDEVIPVPNYTMPQTISEHDSISRTIKRKCMHNIRREIPAYAPPFYRPLPNQLKYLYR